MNYGDSRDLGSGKPLDRQTRPHTQWPTENVEDLVVVEDVLVDASYTPLYIGTTRKGFTNLRLAVQKEIEGTGTQQWVRRIWATTARTGQEAYNLVKKFTADATTAPIYIRNYVSASDTPLTEGTTLKAVIGLTVTSAGSGYVTAPTLAFSGGSGTGAAGKVQIRDGAIVGVLLTNGGSGYTSAPTVTVSSGTATVTAAIQSQTAYLVKQESKPSEGELGSLFFDITRVWMELPGPWVPFTDYDEQMGPIYGRRRAVLAAPSTQIATQTATVRTNYEGLDGSSVVSTQIEKTNSDGSGSSASNAAYPIIFKDFYEKNERGAVQIMEQLVTATGSEAGTLSVVSGAVFTRTITNAGSGYTSAPTIAITGDGTGATAIARISAAGTVVGVLITNPGSGYTTATAGFSGGGGTSAAATLGLATSLVIETSYDSVNQFHLKKSVEIWTIPGPILTGEPKIDDDGATMTTTRNLDIASAITEGELVSVGGVWTETTSEAYSGDTGGTLRWKNTQARILKTGAVGPTVCPIIREDRWNDQYNTVMATFRQYVPENTTKQLIGAPYLTADTYVTDSITALTVSDPGSGYTTIPTFIISAPNEAGGTQATVSVTAGATTLKVVAATVSAPGSGYLFGDTVTAYGGTSTTAAILTVSGGKLASLAINTGSRGTGYVVGDTVALGGGVASSAGTVAVSTLALVSIAPLAAGTGYDVNDEITLVNATATSTTAAALVVTTTKVVTAAISAAGSGYTNGAQNFVVATGTGTQAIVSIVVTGGVPGGAVTIVSAGSYSANPTLTGSATTTALSGTGLTLDLTVGVNTVSITIAGSYTVGVTGAVTPYSHSGGTGIGATFSTAVFGINTVSVTNSGAYSAPAVTTFTAASTSGSGTGAVFQTATYTINQITITTAGAYTAIPGSPNAVTTTTGTGTGLTVNLDFGVGTVALGTAGTLYYYPPTITPSYGTAIILPTMSDPIIQVGTLTGYVVDTGLLNTEHSKMKRLVWSTMYIPPSRIERATKQFPLPNVFTWLSNWDLHPPSTLTKKGPFPGVNFTNVDNGVSVFPARCFISYSRGPSGSIPRPWQVITPAVSSIIFRIGANTIHNAWTAVETDGSTTQNIEIMPASTPSSYVRGQSLIVEVSEKKVAGPFYERRIYVTN